MYGAGQLITWREPGGFTCRHGPGMAGPMPGPSLECIMLGKGQGLWAPRIVK